MKEVHLGRYAGPFKKPPFESFMQSPIGLVPKAGNQTRLIFHLSYDFGEAEESKSLNYHTPERFCSVKYKDLDYAIKTCLRLKEILDSRSDQRRRTGAGRHRQKNKESSWDSPGAIFMAKSDLKSAFRILPSLVRQRKFLLLKAYHPITKKPWFFVDKNLPFGGSSSCKIF